MPVTLKLSCGGCDATADATGPLRKRFVSFSGQDHGFGTIQLDGDPEDLAPEGWVMFDPYTFCTYCPDCWASILAPNTTDDIANSAPKMEALFSDA